MAHLWSGRFEGSPDAALFEFGASFRFDRRLFEDDVTGQPRLGGGDSRAPACSRPQEAAAIKAALDEILDRRRRSGVLRFGGGARTTRTCTRSSSASWSQRVGDAGRRLHTGRSRNEQVALDLRLYLKRRVPLLQQSDRGARRGARSTRRTPPAMRSCRPTRTCAARSRSSSSHFFLAHVAALRRDHARFAFAARRDRRAAARLGRHCRHQLSPSTSSALAARLGFSRVVANSIDATGERDFVSSFLHAAALTMVHLSRHGRRLHPLHVGGVRASSSWPTRRRPAAA